VQIDHVRELEVVTGTGQIVSCSETSNPDLFKGVLGGVGQLGIITRAVVDLVPARQRARSWILQYLDPAACFRDFRLLHMRGELDDVFVFAVPPTSPGLVTQTPPPAVVAALGPLAPATNLATRALGPLLGLASSLRSLFQGVWIYQISVTKYYDPGENPSAAQLLRGRSDLRLLRYRYNQTYLEYVSRVDVLVDLLKNLGLWHGVPKPWFDVFLPSQVTESFVTSTVRELRFDDIGQAGFVLCFPIRRDLLKRRFFNVPESDNEWIYLFDILPAAPAPGPNTAFVADKLARNRRLYEQARGLGATIYPIGATELTPSDWMQQFGAQYAEFAALKATFDPDGILTPGPNVF
ncbi:MAG: hypothetical protein ACRERV_02160, partial [Methylococcales bacterium]